MNFLGHFYLSPPADEAEILLGNFLGDFLKGNACLHQLPPGVNQGLLMHRKIDTFTDHHHCILEAKKTFSGPYRRYSGIILDMCLDHFLARHWSDYSQLSLADFSHAVYSSLQLQRDKMPQKAKAIADSMRRYNWLCSYARLDNIQIALKHIGERLRHKNPLHTALTEIRRLYNSLEAVFRLFIHEIKTYIDLLSLTESREVPGTT